MKTHVITIKKMKFMKKNKAIAGYHLLMILSAVDGKFSVKEDYRLGLVIRKNKVWLIRCEKRSRIYKQFP